MRRLWLLAPLLLVACSGGDDDVADPPTTTTTAAAPDATSSTARSTSTTAGSDRCDVGEAPAPRGQLTYAGVHLRGDDTAYTFLADGAWHLRVDLGDDGGSADEALTTVPSDTASVATGRDLDGDGSDELFVIVGNGAAAQIYGIYALDGCDLEAVQLDGQPAELAVGGSVVELHGLRCDERGVTVLTATSDDGVDYTTNDTTYALADGALLLSNAHPGSTTTSDPDFPALSQFAC